MTSSHAKKKLNQVEWAKVVNKGCMVKAVKALKPIKPHGPWHVLCDNESFLRAKLCNAAHKAQKIILWKMPAKAPDLNPVEGVWGWMRKQLRAMDLKDAMAKRPVLGKTAYKARVRSLARSRKLQSVASSQTLLMKKVCREVVRRKGEATSF